MLNPQRGVYHSYANDFKFGLLGASLFDLYHIGRFTFENKKLALSDKTPTSCAFLDRIIEKAARTRPLSVARFLGRLSMNFQAFKREMIRFLIDSRVIVPVRKQFLFIVYYRYFPYDSVTRQELIHRMRNVLLRNESPQENELFLILLIQVCNLYRPLSDQRAERKFMRRRAKTILSEIDRYSVDAEHLLLLHSGIRQAIITANVNRSAAGAG